MYLPKKGRPNLKKYQPSIPKMGRPLWTFPYVKYIPQFFFRLAEKKSIIDYLLLDPAERLRTNIMHVPSNYKSSVIRAPVPWKQSRVVAQQYCR